MRIETNILTVYSVSFSLFRFTSWTRTCL